MIFFVKLFFFDDGASTRKQEESGSSSEESDTDSSESADNLVEPTKKVSTAQRPVANRSVWADPDDERLRVSIASDKRLRKLRVEESEDVITGSDYENRLRRQ
jgi:U3 small nucleolar RNA-associated protein 18